MSILQRGHRFGFALGGLAGNNAHGAGLLQAAIDGNLHPFMITCTSGQIYWVFHYLRARTEVAGDMERLLREEIEKTAPSGDANIDMALLAAKGREGVFRLTYLQEYPLDLLRNSFAATIDFWQRGGKAFYLNELLKIWPARTVRSLLDPSFFEKVSDAFNQSSMGIAFNSYDPRQGIEFVHLNAKARDLLGGKKAGDKSSYRDRTVYKDITPQYVRDGFWIYEYGFDDQSRMLDGAYYRQIMLSELAKAKANSPEASEKSIVVARPINTKWIGDLPRTWVAREDLKTEVSFNGLYQGERDKIKLINRLIEDDAFSEEYRRKYQRVQLIELEIESQESFFDYVFEDMEVFHSSRDRGNTTLRRLADEGYESSFAEHCGR